MRIPIVNKTIQQRLHNIGIQGENNIEEITFVLPRMYKNVDLSDGLAYMYIVNAKKEIIVVKLDSELECSEDNKTENLLFKWVIGREVTQTKGMLNVQIVINGLNNELWKSEISTFTVSQSIDAPTTLPIMYNSKNVSLLTQEPNNEPPITISNRKFFIPSELKNIAVQNDENSEAVKIILPRYFDGHDLSKYTICLKGVSEGGRSDVVFLAEDRIVQEKEIQLNWTLKPPQTSYSGTLQIQLFVTGQDFKWETEIGEVNILESLDSEPVIPTTLSYIDEFLKQIQQQVSKAESDAQQATQQANTATAKANEAKESATQALASANKSKESATQASSSASEATKQASLASQHAASVQNQAKESLASANKSAQSATDAAQSAAAAQKIKDSTEIFYTIDKQGNRVGFRRANETQFNYTSSLKGDKGDVGPQGPQGSIGATGPIGPQGIQGPKGKDGLAVSVNGVTHVNGNITLTPANIGASASGHTHDDRYYTETEINTKLNTKVDKTQVKNTLTETTSGNVLDASQGKVLNDKINVLEDSKVNKASYFVEDFNNIGTNERFLRSGAYTPNAPSIGQFTGVRSVWDSGFDFVIGADISGVFWIRESKKAWQQIATTKRAIITSYLNGWGSWANVYHLRLDKIGSRVICSGILTIGVKDNGTVICMIPEGFRPTEGFAPRFLKGNNGDTFLVTFLPNGGVQVDMSANSPWTTTASTLIDFSCSWEV